MIHYLFIRIPNLFFLPIAVCATMGCIAAAVKYCKNHNPFYWIIVLSICIMCFWRLAANTLMLSARYASVLLYPAIIFAAWFCCQISDLLQTLIEKHKNNPPVFIKLQKSIPYFTVTLLVIACLIKTLHYSPYTDHTIKLCNVLRKEIIGKEFLIYTHTDEERIAYYAGIDINKIWSMDNQKSESIHELLKQRLEFSKNFLEDIYVIFYLRKDEQEPDAQTLQLDPSIGKWEYVHREYTSRRKNKEMVLYHFSPAHPNIEIWEEDITEMSPANLYVNGDFEQPLTGKELEERIDYYIKRHASDFYTTPGRLFPKSWWLGVPPQEPDGQSPEIALTETNPIAGKYSLEINGNGHGIIGTNSVYVRKQDGILTGYIYALKDSIVLVCFDYWNTVQNNPSDVEKIYFNTAARKTYRFRIPFHESDIPENDRSIFTIVQSSGHILTDNIEFIPTSDNQ